MKEDKNSISEKIQKLRHNSYEGIQEKYASLLLDVIEENLKFEGEIAKCKLDHKMLEDLLLTKDAHFLTNEFGRSLLQFPESFVVACMRLYNEFQKDFPNAKIVDVSKKNQVYMKNYSMPKQYFYYMAEFDDVRKSLRKIISKFAKALDLKAIPQEYIVVAKNSQYTNDMYRLKIYIYISCINDYPHIFETELYSTPISDEALSQIEAFIVRLSKSQQWGNQIYYDFYLCMNVEELNSIAPQLFEKHNELDKIFKLNYVPQRFLGVKYSNEIII